MPLRPIPDGLVVLTFDDGSRSDLEFVAPLLREHQFSATFFVNRSGGAPERPRDYLNWAEIAQLHALGFEIGNHTCSHPNMVQLSPQEIRAEIAGVEAQCTAHGLPRPVTFGYPGGHHNRTVLQVLDEMDYRFARRSAYPEFPIVETGERGRAYDPAQDHPLLVPSSYVSGPANGLTDVQRVLDQARDGKIAVLTLHGVPDIHPHCSTDPDLFAQIVACLAERGCTVVALRDLARYVDVALKPDDPYAPIVKRCGVRPVALRCDFAVDPLGIDNRRPRFSWRLEADRRDQSQAAYQILVAGSAAALARGEGDLWDSGRVDSADSVGIAYGGAPLASGQHYHWQVRCWNKSGNEGAYSIAEYLNPEIAQALSAERCSDYSAPAHFEMGLLDPGDWRGRWVASPDAGVSAPLLRREFSIAAGAEIARARAYVSGLGYFELTVNGRKVGENVLDPATSYYDNDQPFALGGRVLYAVHDITGLLRGGANAIGLMLGHGWFSKEADVPESPGHRDAYGDRPVALVQVVVELGDGTVLRVASDETWQTAAGPILYNDYNHGETYDATREQDGWDEVGFDDSDWAAALVVRGPQGRLAAQSLPPIRVAETLPPVSVSPRGEAAVYDFGQCITGWTQLRTSGAGGGQITVRHAQCLHADGTLDQRANLLEPHPARQLDTYIPRGTGEEVYEPRFTLHGFRYAEVTGLPAAPSAAHLQARFVHSAVEPSGSFECASDLFNQIHANACRTFRGSLQGMPQDAAERAERVAWLGDPGFVAEDYILNFDTASFWTKWLDDIADSQREDGCVPVVSPIHWRDPHDCYGPETTEWQSTYPLLVWHLYWHYGDTRVLETHCDGLMKLVDYISALAEDHVLPFGFGDHMEPQPDGTSSSGPVATPAALTSNAYYYFDTWIVAEVAAILGRRGDAARYRKHAAAIKAGFNRTFLDEETNQYGRGSQCANAMALYLDLVPAARRAAVVDNLVRDIRENHDDHLSTGIIGTNALIHALHQCGRADMTYEIASQTTFPSWGEQVARGATTLWETWEGNLEYSFNMKMFGSLEKFFYWDVLGIRGTAPGYGRIEIAPQLVDRLEWARGGVQTVRGYIGVDWCQRDDGVEMAVDIPANCRAEVIVPGSAAGSICVDGAVVWEKGGYVPGMAGLAGAVEREGAVALDAGPGFYRICGSGHPRDALG